MATRQTQKGANEMTNVFTPNIGPATGTSDIIDQIIDAARNGAEKFRLGKLEATRIQNGWNVAYGDKSSDIGGVELAIPSLVKIWMNKIEWEDIFG
jgi:hypothetical protein